MKPIAWIAAAALAIGGAAATAQVQGRLLAQATPLPTEPAPPMPPPPTPPAPPPAPAAVMPATTTPVAPPPPAPIVIDTKVDMHTNPGPPADLHAAREEAVNALHWAKTEGCRSDPSPRDCLRRAQDDYNAAMARIGARR
jgi:hypothetical protein